MGVTSEYIKGFADADGGYHDKTITFTNTQLILLERIRYALEGLGIECRIRPRNSTGSPTFILRITKYDNLKRYQDLIGFGHPRKRRLLAEYVAHMERPGALYNWEEANQADLLRRQGHSSWAIAKELNIPQSTIYRRFRQGLWPLNKAIEEK